jgi:hypothetical protein
MHDDGCPICQDARRTSALPDQGQARERDRASRTQANPASGYDQCMSKTGDAIDRHPWRATIVVLLILGIGWSIKSCSDSSSADVSPQTYALMTCHDGVKNLLKNPTTAQFSDESFSGPDVKLTLIGTVVAENALGGKVTYRYSCDYVDDVAHVRPLTPR